MSKLFLLSMTALMLILMFSEVALARVGSGGPV